MQLDNFMFRHLILYLSSSRKYWIWRNTHSTEFIWCPRVTQEWIIFICSLSFLLVLLQHIWTQIFLTEENGFMCWSVYSFQICSRLLILTGKNRMFISAADYSFWTSATSSLTVLLWQFLCYSMRYVEEQWLNWEQLGPPSFVCVCVYVCACLCAPSFYLWKGTVDFWILCAPFFFFCFIWVMRQTELCHESPVELHWPTSTALNRKC